MVLAGIVLLPFLYSGSDRPSQLEQIMQRGSLIMLTRNGASSYYLGPDGPTGPEFELAMDFSNFLGVRLKVEVAEAFSTQLFGLLESGRGDMIAANLTRTPGVVNWSFNFGPDYLETSTTRGLSARSAPPQKAMADLLA